VLFLFFEKENGWYGVNYLNYIIFISCQKMGMFSKNEKTP